MFSALPHQICETSSYYPEIDMPDRPRIEIEYCTQCRWLLRAASMAQELLVTFEQEILNNVKLFPPDMSSVSPTLATLQSADRPRVMQLALRFNF
jgi:Rdx family